MKSFSFRGVIATYVEKMKMLDYCMIANGKEVIKGFFPISKVLVFVGNSYVCWKNENIGLFYDCKMVKNVIKGSFPMSKVLVFERNSYICWKNEDN